MNFNVVFHEISKNLRILVAKIFIDSKRIGIVFSITKQIA